MDYWAFSMAGSFLPYILAQKGAARNISTYETYRNYIIQVRAQIHPDPQRKLRNLTCSFSYILPHQACCGIPGVILGALLVEIRWLGAKWSMAITGALMGVSLFLFAVIDSQEGNVAFNAVEYFFQSGFNAVRRFPM